MNRLKCFKIHWHDVWYHFNEGIVSTLVLGENFIQIDFLVNAKRYTIDISDFENDFIEQLQTIGILEIDGKIYHNFWFCDGYGWEIAICYDDVEIHSSGSNKYPPQFLKLMEYLHEKWNLPIYDIEKAEIYKKK